VPSHGTTIPQSSSVFLLPRLLTSLLLPLAIEETGSLLAPRLCLAIKRADVVLRDRFFLLLIFPYIPSSASVRFADRSPRGHRSASLPPALTAEMKSHLQKESGLAGSTQAGNGSLRGTGSCWSSQAGWCHPKPPASRSPGASDPLTSSRLGV
jgi:hypothetical protein